MNTLLTDWFHGLTELNGLGLYQSSEIKLGEEINVA